MPLLKRNQSLFSSWHFKVQLNPTASKNSAATCVILGKFINLQPEHESVPSGDQLWEDHSARSLSQHQISGFSKPNRWFCECVSTVCAPPWTFSLPSHSQILSLCTIHNWSESKPFKTPWLLLQQVRHGPITAGYLWLEACRQLRKMS